MMFCSSQLQDSHMYAIWHACPWSSQAMIGSLRKSKLPELLCSSIYDNMSVLCWRMRHLGYAQCLKLQRSQISTAGSRPAVEHFTQRVFGMPSAEFFPSHQLMLSTLRKALVPAELARHLQRLAALVLQRLQRSCAGMPKVSCLRSFLECLLCRIPLLHALVLPNAFTDRVFRPQGCCSPDCLACKIPP